MGYVSGEGVRCARTEIGTGNGSRRQDAARYRRAPAGCRRARADRACDAPARGSRRYGGCPGGFPHGRPGLPEARQPRQRQQWRGAWRPAPRQAASGGSGAAQDRRQRRCPLDRRPDLFAAAEAVQPAVPGRGGCFRRMVRHRRHFCLGHAGVRRVDLFRPDAGRGHSHRSAADSAHLVPGAARLAGPGAETDVLGHDRGGGAAGGARSRGRAVGGLSRPGGAPTGLVHERGHLARARAGRRARGAGPQRSGGAGQVLRRERAQDQRLDPGAGRRAARPRQHHRQGRRNLEVDGQRGAHADREAFPAADQAGQDHRGRGAEPDRAREQAHDRQRRPRNRARQSHPAAAGGARRLHGGPRRHAGQPRRGARHAAGGAHARARCRLLRAAGAVRQFDAALGGRHRQRGQREGARAHRRHGEPCARAVRHAGPASRQHRPVHDDRHRGGAPHQRQHHAPVAQGHRRPFQPGRRAEGGVGDAGAPDIRRDQPIRQPGPVDRERRQRAGGSQRCASTPRCRSGRPSSTRPCTACRGTHSSSTR